MAQLITSTSEATQSFKPVDTFDMVIDEESYGRLIKQSINMYQNAPAAVFREYVTNAWDAHIAAGNTDTPIEVSIPQGFDKNELVIKDYGVGLDREGLKTYVTVGKSTKDVAGNQETGSFGQGCKSALAMVSQFNVISVKDGMKYFAVVGENDKGGFGMDVFKAVETIEPNGVTIKIKLDQSQASNMSSIAHRFLSYWDKGTVLLNGEQPKHYLDDTPEDQKIVLSTGSLVLNGRDRYSVNVNVKMGSVVYPVDLDALWQSMGTEQRELFQTNTYSTYQSFVDSIGAGRGSEILLNAPLSSLKLVPSRDALIYTNKDENTVGTLVSLLALMKSEIQDEAQAKIDAASSYAEAEDTLKSVKKLLSSDSKLSDFSWNGVSFSDKIAEDDDEKFSTAVFTSSTYENTLSHEKDANGRRITATNKYSTDFLRVVIDANESESKLTSHRAAVRDYVKSVSDKSYRQDNERRAMRITVFSGSALENPWVFENDNIIKLSLEKVQTEAKAYRKWAREQNKQYGVGVDRSAETLYETHYVLEGRRHASSFAVSGLPETIKTVIIGKELPSLSWTEFFMRADNVALMSLKGGRSENKLKSNLEAAGFRVLTVIEWIDELVASRVGNERAVRLQVLDSLGHRSFFKSIVRSYESAGLTEELLVNGIKVSEWVQDSGNEEDKRIAAINQVLRFHGHRASSIPEVSTEELEKVTAMVPSDEQIAEKYPMVSVVAANNHQRIGLEYDREAFKIMVSYMTEINNAG